MLFFVVAPTLASVWKKKTVSSWWLGLVANPIHFYSSVYRTILCLLGYSYSLQHSGILRYNNKDTYLNRIDWRAKRSKIQNNVFVYQSHDVVLLETNERICASSFYLFIYFWCFRLSRLARTIATYTIHIVHIVRVKWKVGQVVACFSFSLFRARLFCFGFFFWGGNRRRVEKSVLCYQSVNFSAAKDHKKSFPFSLLLDTFFS